eukprot:TRINITY_DN44812_c0_g1_i1.p1 TRINITY_DN44812_c0_g1~~TRINITY_DN44812_c0_g1_i1.p1  ORF type:complete len:202 (-),score=23.13 TRINITY_DN44812_c0_g1_i1:198-803(-)
MGSFVPLVLDVVPTLATAFVVTSVADIACQFLEISDLTDKFNEWREGKPKPRNAQTKRYSLGRTVRFGASFGVPLGLGSLLWYPLIERSFPGTALAHALAKTGMNCCIFIPVMMPVCMTIGRALEGHDFETSKASTKTRYLSMVLSVALTRAPLDLLWYSSFAINGGLLFLMQLLYIAPDIIASYIQHLDHLAPESVFHFG